MKGILLIVFLLSGFYSDASDTDSLQKQSRLIVGEIKTFIDTVKQTSYLNGLHNVYVIRFFEGDVKSKELCFTLGVIINSSSLDLITAQYYFKMNDEIVVMNFNNTKAINYFGGCNLQKVDSSSRSDIMNKLCPNSRGVYITNTSKGVVCCFNGDNIEKIFYKNSDLIPEEASIWDYRLESGKMEIIYDPDMEPLKPTQK